MSTPPEPNVWPPAPNYPDIELEEPTIGTYPVSNALAFRHWRTWILVVLSLVTLDLIQYFWLYGTAKTLKTLKPSVDITPAVFLWLFGAIALLLVFRFTQILSVDSVRLLNLPIVLVYFVNLFIVRNQLNILLGYDDRQRYWMGGIGTFFLRAIYLNYKINRARDAAFKLNSLNQPQTNQEAGFKLAPLE